MKFWRDHASYPFRSHELWFLTEDQRWRYLPADLDTKALIAKVNREDLWREAAKMIGVPADQMPPRLLRAGWRPSSTARSSIPRIRPPISPVWRSSGS